MSEITLHGPPAPRCIDMGRSKRPVIIYPRFDWIQVSGEWVQDFSEYMPMTFPQPLPDYLPGELERIEAAEAKRVRKGLDI